MVWGILFAEYCRNRQENAYFYRQFKGFLPMDMDFIITQALLHR